MSGEIVEAPCCGCICVVCARGHQSNGRQHTPECVQHFMREVVAAAEASDEVVMAQGVALPPPPEEDTSDAPTEKVVVRGLLFREGGPDALGRVFTREALEAAARKMPHTVVRQNADGKAELWFEGPMPPEKAG